MSLPPLQFQIIESSLLPAEGLRHGDLLAGKIARVTPDGRPLLSFNGWRTSPPPIPGLRAGDLVLAAVQKLDSSIKLALLSDLKIGGTFTAEMLSSRSSEALIRLGKVELRAQLPPGGNAPEPGSTVQGHLQLVAGKPVILIDFSAAPEAPSTRPQPAVALQQVAPYTDLLKMLANQGMMLQDYIESLISLLHHLPKQLFSQWPWLGSLLKILQNMQLDPGSDDVAAQLASNLKNSGIFLESRLLQSLLLDDSIHDDFKLVLLKTAQEVAKLPGDSASPLLAQVSEKVNQLLGLVRAEQAQNLSLAPTKQLYVQLPLSDSGGLRSLEILISSQKDQKKAKVDSKNVILTVAVSTSRLGRIKAGIFIGRGRMTCQFKASEQWVADLIEKNAGLLKIGIEKLNYSVVHIGCTVTSDEQQLSVLPELPSNYQNGFVVYV